jgi:hypothetical protein
MPGKAGRLAVNLKMNLAMTLVVIPPRMKAGYNTSILGKHDTRSN